jgi:hypothetical protein
LFGILLFPNPLPQRLAADWSFGKKGENNFAAMEKRLNLPPSFLSQKNNHEQS